MPIIKPRTYKINIDIYFYTKAFFEMTNAINVFGTWICFPQWFHIIFMSIWLVSAIITLNRTLSPFLFDINMSRNNKNYQKPIIANVKSHFLTSNYIRREHRLSLNVKFLTRFSFPLCSIKLYSHACTVITYYLLNGP